MRVYDETKTVLAMAPAARGSNGAVNGTTVDRVATGNRFRSVYFSIVTGVLTDGAVTFKLQDSDNNSSWADVAAGLVQGTAPVTTASTDNNKVFDLGYLGTKRYVRVVATTASVPGATKALVEFTPAAGGADAFDYSAANGITFTINDGSGASTVALNSDLNNLAGVVAAVDAALDAGYVVSADTTLVKIEAASAGAKTFTIAGTDAEDITGSAGYVNTAGTAGVGGVFGAVAVLGQPKVAPTH